VSAHSQHTWLIVLVSSCSTVVNKPSVFCSNNLTCPLDSHPHFPSVTSLSLTLNKGITAWGTPLLSWSVGMWLVSVSGLVDDLDKPAYFLLVSTLLLDVARSHPLQYPMALIPVELHSPSDFFFFGFHLSAPWGAWPSVALIQCSSIYPLLPQYMIAFTSH
jgi:hypothetical protein